MEKKESSNEENMKKQNFESKKLKASLNSKKQKDKSLPWWVELLFVQIGLPEKLLVKILKTNKNYREVIRNDKKLVFIFLFFLIAFAYFYPIVKQSKNKLECEATAKNYIIKKKNLNSINRKELKMLSTNFCNGGKEIYEIENIKR
tara:strand:+ start:522 stop:959 length:438 start_codon:yes stop_codon:yes gene_type:complete